MSHTSPLSTSSEVATPPSSNDVEAFLIAISNWLQQADARLTCAEQSAKLNYTLEVLTAVHTHAHGPPSRQIADTSKLSPYSHADTTAAAVLSMQLSVLCSVCILAGLWYVIFTLLSWTIPGLRVLSKAARLRGGLQHSQEAIGRDVLLGQMTGALRRRANQHQFYAACVCTCMAALLIAMLLTVDVWTGLVLCKMWEAVTAPLRQTWSWASDFPFLSPRRMTHWVAAAAPRSLVASDLLAAARVPQVIAYVPHLIKQIAQHLQVMYFWHLVGGVVLGLSLWLLQFAHHCMRTYSDSVPFVTSRSTEPQLLRQLDDAEERRRSREVRRLQIATMRQNQLLLERVQEVERGTALLVEAQHRAALSGRLLEEAIATVGEPSAADADDTRTSMTLGDEQRSAEVAAIGQVLASAHEEAQRSAAPLIDTKHTNAALPVKGLPREEKDGSEHDTSAAEAERSDDNAAAA
ncbi:hypothetical protein ABB37_05171 [Leptomonas pyrrhocoris]|uniref:Uncharacterized protein n=1 Tax=Leptomonas pyrrhocoris TaxID=157538 RepID=A0A0M9G100_LEPPY|nr:hypothetical protein ABB37_05171 [Leptomonas pyrrhocoris]KPA80190.1 hypothetical protein ABB37_05171 [Leptomonas pyrrhocoris]|eukprot:XP_015658629.1 hypothetical protein ABB37_05171 [Leptomonas pyrrhocoris]